MATVLLALPLLLLCYDIGLCLAFYREANRARPAYTAERPRQLAPDQVTLRHALLFLVQKANYYWQFINSVFLLVPLLLRPKKTTDDDVARLLVSTSLVTWAEATRDEDGAVTIKLDLSGFAFPHLPDRFDNRLVVETELRLIDEQEPELGFVAHTSRFDWNGEPIESRSEQLSILAIMIAFVVHPVVHSFNNVLYRSHDDPALADYEDLFLHGQYLNSCAWYWPGKFFRIPCPRGGRWVQRVLAHNAELSLPRHTHRSLGVVAPYSRTIRFMLAARPAIARRRKEYDVQVDGEALFLCTVLHAIDHLSCDVYTRGHHLEHERLPSARGHNLLALVFYRPSQYFMTNLLRDKHHKTPFYRALYQDLRAIDPELADHVTLSIAY